MLSVIIPAFNCEKTIAACVNSLLSRKTLNKEIEIIIVDDGSTDNTRTVAEDLKKQHKHVKVLAQENKGAGAARNLGIEHAEGEYLWFIDGDDVVNENSINVISYELSRYKPQILVFNYKLFDESKNSYIANSNRDTNIYKSIPTGKTFDINQFPELLEAISYPWNKVYETSFVKEKKLAFSETIVNNDIFFNVASLSCAKRIVKIDDALYTHFVNKVDGQLTQIFDKRRLNPVSYTHL
ncbi:glycosyltransferase, partial [Sutterella massiliensis]